MAETPPSDSVITEALSKNFIQNSKLHLNLSQDTIVITEDKIRLCLMEYRDRLEVKRGWVAPAGILVTIVATFATTTFRDFLLEASAWKAFFAIAGICNFGWLVHSVLKAIRVPEIEDIVSRMKQAGTNGVESRK